MVLEIENYIAILKKSCASINNVIDRYLNRIDHFGMLTTFNDDDVEFQKLSLRNMTISERALRSRSFEAADLKGLLSTHAAGRSIPYYLKIRDRGKIKTITTNSARLVESESRKSIDSIALWVDEQIRLFSNPAANKPFLDSFARPIALSDVLSTASPKAILIESSALFNRLEREELPLNYKTKKREG